MERKKKTVLIVEDRSNWRGLFQDLLEKDFEVATAESYEVALQLLAAQLPSFHVAVVDIRLDDADMTNEKGLNLASEIREKHPSTQIVMVTAYPTLQTAKIAFQELQVFDYMEKYPADGHRFDRIRFRETVRQAAEKAEKQQEQLAFSVPTIGFVTALPKELAAMQSMLENPRQHDVAIRDGNQRYFLGEIPGSNGERHQVVLALMPDMGTNPAAVITTRLLHHFPSVLDVIMVGIAGGVPHPTKPDDHVRLGDVVVSGRDGVVQYDDIKEGIRGTKHRHPPRPPRANLLSAVCLLETEELAGKRPWLQHIERANHLHKAARPPKNTDKLRNFAYPDTPTRITHPRDPKRIPDQPRVFVGPIASADTLLKNPQKRDELRDRFGVKAVEMEGSGVANATWMGDAGYLVVRGICDYCDPDKTDRWQEYAAVAAAAYTRALLESMPAAAATTDLRAGNQPTGTSPAGPANVIERPGQARQPAVAHTQLRQKLVTTFNVSELRTLCFDLGVDYEDIPGAAKEEMARELVAYFERNGRIPDLIQYCRSKRPHVAW